LSNVDFSSDYALLPFQSISERTSALDRVVTLSTDAGKRLERYLNLPNVLKSTIDRLSPAKPWPDLLLLNRYYNVAVSGWDLQRVTTTYVSEGLTNFGEYRVLFGPLGGLAAVFFVAYLFGRLYHGIAASASPYRLLKLLWVLYVFGTLWLLSFGTDYIVYLIWGGLLSMLLYLAGLWALAWFTARRGVLVPDRATE
jgi:hypothetical protein